MIGHSINDTQQGLSQLGKTNLDDVLKFLNGKGFAEDAQAKIREQLIFGGKPAVAMVFHQKV